MISKTALHTLKAVVALAERPGEFQGAAHIAEQIGAPQNYLGKLLQGLVQTGIVHSQKGMGGGFCLAKDPAAVTLFDVVDRVDHVTRWEGCFMGNGACDASAPCALHHQWAAVRDAYLKMLKDATLADIVEHRSDLPVVR